MKEMLILLMLQTIICGLSAQDVIAKKTDSVDVDTMPFRCQQKMDPGPCRGAFERYFFNAETGKCEMFLYGGCQGSENVFMEQEQCEETCQPDKCKSAICMMECANGFDTDIWGCRICQCKAPPPKLPPMNLAPCPEYDCEERCPQGYVLDDNGCPSCTCLKENKNCQQEVMCNLYCPNGFKLKQDGCPKCECTDEAVCPEYMCTMYCENGFKKDQNGCQVCQCADKPACSEVACNMYCPDGFKDDKNGCPLCECEENPCDSLSCDIEETCNIDRSVKPHTAKCIPGRRWCSEQMCMMYCENGFVSDKYGCPKCQCRNTTQGCAGEEKCTNTCTFGYAYDVHGCRTCACLDNGCKDYVCEDSEKVCGAQRFPGCPFCPVKPKCIGKELVTRVHVTMRFWSGERGPVNPKTLTSALVQSISTLADVPAEAVVSVSVQVKPDQSLDATFHLKPESNAVKSYENFLAALQEDKCKVEDQGVTYLPDTGSISVTYYTASDEWEDLDASYETIIIIIAVAMGILLLLLTLTVVLLACRKRTTKYGGYHSTSIYKPVSSGKV